MPDSPAGWDEATVLRVADTINLGSTAIRIRILATLSGGERSVGDLSVASGVGIPSLSVHLKKMLASMAVEADRRGQLVFYGLTEKGMAILKAAEAFAKLED